MKKIFIAFVVLSMGLLLHSCYYDKEDLLYGGTNVPCTDTAGTVSYASKVVPLLQQNCYSCHTGSFPSGNITMGTYTADKVIATNGKLYGTISYASGFSPMPKGGSKFNNCQLALVKKWIDSGCPNN